MAAPDKLLRALSDRRTRPVGRNGLTAPRIPLRQHLSRRVLDDAAEVILGLAAARREPGDVRVQDLLVGLGKNLLTLLVMQVVTAARAGNDLFKQFAELVNEGVLSDP